MSADRDEANSAAIEISIVVPTRNRAGRLRALLESLREQVDAPPFEVIVVDNCSDDDTLAAVADSDSAGAHLRAVHLPEPMGPAVARNRGWRSATGALVVFTDDDVVARPGWLAAIAAAHRRDAEAIIQGKTDPDPREIDRLSAFARSQSATGPGPWFQTCNIAYPRTLLERLDGFDESFWEAAGEDTDLGWRAVEQGARVVYEPAALNWHAVHEPGALALIRSTQKWRIAVRNVANHPGLRAALHRRVFWKPSHERLLIAAAGLTLAKRLSPAAAVLAIPYLLLHRTQHGSYAGTLAALPSHVALDAAEVVAMLRGSIEARTLVL
jgi:glycosyltransferase involved in cell wall biosynthesis